jgi:hypothetical protein
VNTSFLGRIAPILMLVPLALLADCGGSDNSDLNAAQNLRDAGFGDARADASDARTDGRSPCPPLEPREGFGCPEPMLVCEYGDRLCVCSSDVPWACFGVVDGGLSPDASGGRGGTGGTGGGGAGGTGGAAGTSSDAGADTSRPPDAGRDGSGGATDAQADTRDGRGGGGSGGTSGTGGGGGRGGRGGGAGRGGTGGGARDGAVDSRAGLIDARGADGLDPDGATDDGVSDDGGADDGATVDAGDDSG